MHRPVSHRVRAAVLALTLFWSAAACGDDPASPPTPQSIAASAGGGQTATVGELLGTALAVLVTGSDGAPLSGQSVTWQVTAGGGSVTPSSSSTDASGTATAQWTLGGAAGAQTVTATVQGLAPVTFTATATPGAPAELAVAPGAPVLDALGATVQLGASLRDAFGNALGAATFAWVSDDESVVTVDAVSGLATAVAVGEATVTASAEGLEGSATIEVRQVPAAVVITPDAPEVPIGGTLQLSAEVLDANDNPIPAATVGWSTGSDDIATVDADGLLTGAAEGTTPVTATSGEASESVTATVILDADDFAPTEDVEIGGAMTVGAFTVPAGVTVTVTADLQLTALRAIQVDGVLAGDCVRVAIAGRDAATYTGTVSNTCSGGDGEAPPEIALVNDGPLSVEGASFAWAGGLEIKNNPDVGDDDFQDLEADGAAIVAGGRSLDRRWSIGEPARAVGGPCIVIGGTFEPSAPAASGGDDQQTFGGAGASAGDVTLTCDGDLQIRGDSRVEGRNGGEGGDAMNADPGSDDATGRGGDGGDGGDVNVRATGDITFDDQGGGTTLRLTDGGKGGDATVLGRDPGGSATATGGNGGDGGNMRVQAGGSITIDPGGLTIVVGRGGDGGEAIANAGNGKNADATAATNGGNATATGGDAGHSVDGRLRARGQVNGLGNITVTGGDGGTGGEATAVAGKGGDGNLEFPHGANGGAMQADGGTGGEARTRVDGAVVGRSGDGGDIRVVNGRGGDGADRCSLPASGGNGGLGGSAAGAPGAGGGGDNPGDPGFTTVAAATGNGGSGANGEGPGTGGEGGDDAGLMAGSGRTDEGAVFQRGGDGEACPAPEPKQLRVAFEQIEHQFGSVPFGVQALSLIDTETQTAVGEMPVETLGEPGNHYFGSSPTRVGVAGEGNGWGFRLGDAAVEGSPNPTATEAEVCLVNTSGVSESNPVTVEQRDAEGELVGTTEITDATANGGCTAIVLQTAVVYLYILVRAATVIDLLPLLLLFWL